MATFEILLMAKFFTFQVSCGTYSTLESKLRGKINSSPIDDIRFLIVYRQQPEVVSKFSLWWRGNAVHNCDTAGSRRGARDTRLSPGPQCLKTLFMQFWGKNGHVIG